MQNKQRGRKNTSGAKGVSFDKNRGKWRAHIVVDRHQIYLGRFDSKDDASAAYDKAAKEMYGEFARPNISDL